MAKPRVCWSCRGMVLAVAAFCPTCKVIQPPNPDLDYFQIVALPTAFSVDHALLEKSYQTLQRQFHPDRFATRSAKERRFSLEHVIRLNKAYQTLRDPLLRSNYLLEVWGRKPPEQGESPTTDSAFLMEMMEIQEALESLDLTSAEASDRLDHLRGQTEDNIQSEQEQMVDLFAAFVSSSDSALLEQIAQVNDRFRYHQRFLQSLERAEETLYGGDEG